MADLVAKNITVYAGDIPLLENASLSLRPGELVTVLGPNGAGKSTLLRALLGLQEIASGSVTYDGVNSTDMSPLDRARKVSYLPQTRPLAWPNTVRDVVALGRFAYGATPGRLRSADAEAVDAAIASCDLGPFADRHIDQLSGGELARVHIARTFATRALLLIADEPVAELDPRQQLRIADLIRKFADDGGGALVVLHEISIATRIADRIIWMREGRIVADGPPQETVTEEWLREVYGVRAEVRAHNNGIDVRIESAV